MSQSCCISEPSVRCCDVTLRAFQTYQISATPKETIICRGIIEAGKISEFVKTRDGIIYKVENVYSPQGKATSTLGNGWYGNRLIWYFEFKYLTGLTTYNYNTIAGVSDNILKYDIPSGITTLGNYIVANIPAMEHLYVYPTTPPTINSVTFYGRLGNFTIYVPYGSLQAYQTAQNWSKYADRMVEFDATL